MTTAGHLAGTTQQPDAMRRRGTPHALNRNVTLGNQKKVRQACARARLGLQHLLVALEQHVMAQELPKAGDPGKLDALLIAFLNHDNAEWRYNTIRNSYGWAIHNWVIPNLGEWRGDLLKQRPDAIEKFLKSIAKQKTTRSAGDQGSHPGVPDHAERHTVDHRHDAPACVRASRSA
ncbi:hypothetical protein [Dactylosporangium sp. CA-139066]|uniref:hypothetical protein n=1 Tax=Dactylosporangium sp. CA-139066 TaxID=3239930 RepID=UPI003D89ED03